MEAHETLRVLPSSMAKGSDPNRVAPIRWQLAVFVLRTGFRGDGSLPLSPLVCFLHLSEDMLLELMRFTSQKID